MLKALSITALAAFCAMQASAGDLQPVVLCAQDRGDALQPCPATIERQPEGISQITVTFPSGFFRILSFERDMFLRGNSTMSGVGTDTEWEVVENLHHILVDDQRFVVPQDFLSEE